MILDSDVKEIIATEEDIDKMCRSLGERITKDFDDFKEEIRQLLKPQKTTTVKEVKT